MARLLLVEDDKDMSMFVTDCLTAEQHHVDSAETGSTAQERLAIGKYDLLILDWDLPDISGIDLCKDFRAAGGTTPILMLTGRTHIDDKEAGFDAGADDYLTKPFLMKELRARVRALLRRAAANITESGSGGTGGARGPAQIGNVIGGKYRLDEFLNQGGMALVYRATHIAMGKPVVLKLVHAHLLDDNKILIRFEQECRMMASISHANVATVFDTGLVDGSQPYLVMEYVKGESLTNRLDREGALPIPVALEILIQVCRGLEEAHNAGIVHRDLKPSNVMLQERSGRPDWVKIVDFGLAHLVESGGRLTEQGTVLGSMGYMAPELLRDEEIDKRADIYALGVLFFEMLTDALPYKASSTEAFYIKQLTEAPALPSSKREDVAPGSKLDLIVQRATEKDPARRFQTVAELRCELEKALADASQSVNEEHWQDGHI